MTNDYNNGGIVSQVCTTEKELADALNIPVEALTKQPTQMNSVGSGETVMKTDVEKLIRDWQIECADHPALYNQANVLLNRLKSLKPSLSMNDFLAGMDSLDPTVRNR